MSLQALKRKTAGISNLTDDAHGILRGRLLRGEVVLGQSISRRKLAAELGMSFLPVSMALLRLEYEGFLERKPRAGTRVRIPSPEDIRGHYVVREGLEVQAARLFVRTASPKEIEELRRLALEVDGYVGQPVRPQFVRTHQKFHKRIADGSRCRALSDAIDQVLTLESTWLCAVQQTERPDDAMRKHRHEEFADILAQGDPERAAEAVRTHIAAGLDWLMVALKPYFAQGRKNRHAFARK
jgi:DNA-binding GntR family transcriptional regulator